ncbi:MAG: hypothetical protein DRN99_04390 [Thermoproteota archaeon]|nr:MAG: hypothetical protein DRN99_04390 [Candidatus Korarchaeota archaeon]
MSLELNEADMAVVKLGKAVFHSQRGEVPVRFALLKALLTGPKSQSELYYTLNSIGASVSRQAVFKACHILEEAGVIEPIGEGKNKVYRLSLAGKKLLAFLYEVAEEAGRVG